MEEHVRACLEPLLPSYRDLKQTAPSWTGALGVHLPELALFSSLWAQEEVYQFIQNSLGNLGFQATFSSSQRIGVLVGANEQGVKSLVWLPAPWQARVVSSAILGLGGIPESLDAVRFNKSDALTTGDPSAIKADLLKRIDHAFDQKAFTRIVTQSRTRREGRSLLRGWWREVGERAGIIPADTLGKVTYVGEQDLRRLFDEGVKLIKDVLPWLSNPPADHIERTRQLAAVPLPHGWRRRVRWEAWKTNAEREKARKSGHNYQFEVTECDVKDLATQLRFPMFRLAEIAAVKNEARPHPAVKRLVLTLISGRLGISRRTLERHLPKR